MPSPYRPTSYAYLMCTLAAIFYCYEYLLRVMPAIIVPNLIQTLAISTSQVGMIASFYFLTYTPMQILVGTIMDHFGVRLPLSIATFACAVGAYIFSIPTLGCAQLGMLLIGFGSAFAFVGVLKIAADWLPNHYFALISGITTTLGMLGAISGETSLATVIADHGITQALYGLSALGVLLTILLALTITDKQLLRSTKYIHELQKLLFDLWFVAKKPQIWIVGLIGMLLYTPTTTFAGLWGVPYIQMTRGLNAHDAGQVVSMIFVGWAVGGPLVGMLTNWLQSRKKILVASAVLCAIILIKIIYFEPSSIEALMGWMFLLGFVSSGEILVFAIAHDIIPNNLAGTAVSLTNMLVMVSGVMQYLIGLLLEITQPETQGAIANGLAAQSHYDYASAFIIMPIGLVIAAILSIWLKESYHLKP
jgi:MFS family permease